MANNTILIEAVNTLQESVDILTDAVNIRKTELDFAVNESVNAKNLAEGYADSAATSEQNSLEYLNTITELSQNVIKIRRHDWVVNTSYFGFASQNSLETDPVWNITKTVVDIDGSVETTTANNVAWSDRLIINYL